MTTSPVMSITDELVAELEAHYSGITDPLEFGYGTVRRSKTIMALLAERADLLRKAEVLQLYAPIIDEIDRRAGKQHCIQDQCDFTVTISYEDYAAIAAYDDAQRVKP